MKMYKNIKNKGVPQMLAIFSRFRGGTPIQFFFPGEGAGGSPEQCTNGYAYADGIILDCP